MERNDIVVSMKNLETVNLIGDKIQNYIVTYNDGLKENLFQTKYDINGFITEDDYMNKPRTEVIGSLLSITDRYLVVNKWLCASGLL